MILELSPYYLCLVGRITNLIVCTLIIAMGIKILPQFKKSMLFILLSPVVLAYIASLSADGIIIATSFLFISTILYHKNKKEILSKKSYIGLLLLIIFVSTCKVAYLPLIGLILLLPNQNFKNKKTNIISKIMLISLGIMCSIVSMKIGKISINTSPGEMSLFKSII